MFVESRASVLRHLKQAKKNGMSSDLVHVIEKHIERADFFRSQAKATLEKQHKNNVIIEH